MIKMGSPTSYAWEVGFEIPGPDGGVIKSGITAVYRYLSASEHESIAQQLRDGGSLTDAQFVPRVVCGWRDVLSEDDQPLIFSDENLSILMDRYPLLQDAIVIAYFHSREELRKKNLSRPLAIGLAAA